MEATTFQCTQCKCQLSISCEDVGGSSSTHACHTGLPRLDESFLVLDEAIRQPGAQEGTGAASAAAANRRLEESFVVLPQGLGGRGGPGGSDCAGSASGAAGVARVPFDAKLQALARVFDIASGETKVDFPICADCAAEVHREMEAAVAEAKAECEAYEAALVRLAAEAPAPLEERAFARQLRALQEEAEAEEERVARLERELAGVRAEAAALAAREAEVEGLEERYWAAFNEYQLALQEHLDERDALSHRIEATCTALNMLKRTNVYSDVFRIWFDGPFGTISGLRLGRTSSVHVEWDEINAAWGQAVLLLATLAKACGASFSQYRLLPMGSYPRVADARGTYDLYGPVSKFLCTSYDKAQVGFLACLKEFSEFLRARGASEGGGRGPLVLPWPIEGDRVGGLSIKMLFQKDKNWTKALKYMLVDLKWVLKFAIALMDRTSSAGPVVAALAREDPATARI